MVGDKWHSLNGGDNLSEKGSNKSMLKLFNLACTKYCSISVFKRNPSFEIHSFKKSSLVDLMLGCFLQYN
ncbi:hypothetical protein BpHYR1_038287 [Brachionus plicatilis]|uniref:Uncharacterized protein n=1 Tax=Brachionus plicatilis TaxID=10195 RepID=A0A3M7RNQ2_BRAPC|nr:hypothetical protein BpHYR1_038287 [Brachionus plicatilis]